MFGPVIKRDGNGGYLREERPLPNEKPALERQRYVVTPSGLVPADMDKVTFQVPT